MKKLLILFIATINFILTQAHVSFCQEIATDSKGRGVFTYYSTQKNRIDFSSKDFSLTISTRPIKSIFHFAEKVNDTNVIKLSNYFIQPSLLNASDLITLSNVKTFRPGGKVRIGYQRTIEKINEGYNRFSYALGGNIFYSFDNIGLYNPGTNKPEKEYPKSFGLELNYTQFTPKRWMVLTFTGSLFKGWNNDELIDFKYLDGSITNDKIVAFSKLDGKYGELKENLNKIRLTSSVPIVLFKYYNPIPYTVLLISDKQLPKSIFGVYNNILLKEVNFKRFTMPSSFGLGIDWVKTGNKWSSPNIFLRGNFSFGSF